VTTTAKTLAVLLDKRDNLQAQLNATDKEINFYAQVYWDEKGYTVKPRREALERAVREDAAKSDLPPTPLETCIVTGRAF